MRRPGDSRIKMRAANQRSQVRPGRSVTFHSLSSNFLHADCLEFVTSGLPALPARQSICRCTCCGPGPGCYYSTMQGNGTGKLIMFMADFIKFLCFGEAGHGIYRQSFDVQRLRSRVCLYRRRAAFFPRQAVQERTQALQAVQGEARSRRLQGAPGDPNQLLAVRRGNDGSLQAHPRQAGVVPLLLQTTNGPTRANSCPAATPRVVSSAVTPGRGLRTFYCLSRTSLPYTDAR